MIRSPDVALTSSQSTLRFPSCSCAHITNDKSSTNIRNQTPGTKTTPGASGFATIPVTTILSSIAYPLLLCVDLFFGCHGVSGGREKQTWTSVTTQRERERSENAGDVLASYCSCSSLRREGLAKTKPGHGHLCWD